VSAVTASPIDLYDRTRKASSEIHGACLDVSSRSISLSNLRARAACIGASSITAARSRSARVGGSPARDEIPPLPRERPCIEQRADDVLRARERVGRARERGVGLVDAAFEEQQMHAVEVSPRYLSHPRRLVEERRRASRIATELDQRRGQPDQCQTNRVRRVGSGRERRLIVYAGSFDVAPEVLRVAAREECDGEDVPMIREPDDPLGGTRGELVASHAERDLLHDGEDAPRDQRGEEHPRQGLTGEHDKIEENVRHDRLIIAAEMERCVELPPKAREHLFDRGAVDVDKLVLDDREKLGPATIGGRVVRLQPTVPGGVIGRCALDRVALRARRVCGAR
jgi:hypothetical protein